MVTGESEAAVETVAPSGGNGKRPGGVSLEDKINRVHDQVGPRENEADLVWPDHEKFELGGRIYKIKPLPFRRMKLLARLGKNSMGTEEEMDEGIKLIAGIIGESDPTFIDEHMSPPKLAEMFKILEKVNYRGIPKPKGPQPKN